jgi:RHS repeat-associated protein
VPTPTPTPTSLAANGTTGSVVLATIALKPVRGDALSIPDPAPQAGEAVTRVIDYSYDPRYRLTAADYDDGTFFHYTYDAVGNRITQATLAGMNNYVYDIANRLIEVDGVSYTWDANGNLLNDGMRTYTYNHANRLTGVAQGDDAYTFAYNGLGDRLQQTVNGDPTGYTLDMNTGLTQVLADDVNAYIYGLGKIGELQSDGWQYHLSDALGSVKQLNDALGEIVLAKSFEPFGSVLTGAGEGVSTYGFAGEWQDLSGLMYLRARYYAPYLNQWVQPSTIITDFRNPQSINSYSYVNNNPINYIDPSGKSPVVFSDTDLMECISSQQLSGVYFFVRNDVCQMIPELEEAGFYEDMTDQEHISGGYRDPRTAHLVSTAYHIIHDHISIDELRETPRDMDGTIWFRDEWKYIFPDCPGLNIASQWLLELRVKQNAANLIPTDYYNSDFYVWVGVWRIKSSPYALEGYPAGDPRRLPNSDNPAISKHVLRQAVDIFIGFSNQESVWDREIDAIASDFHMVRPYHELYIDYADLTLDEWWHFERK